MQRLPPRSTRTDTLFPYTTLIRSITVLAVFFGLSGMRFALSGEWEIAVGMVVLAAVFDALDGRMARLLRAQSKFGAELDSLSDFVSFGVVPGVIVYLWALQPQIGRAHV